MNKMLTLLFCLMLSLSAGAQALSYGWYGPIWPNSQTIDVQFTQSGMILVELNGDPATFVPYGTTNAVPAYPVFGSGTLRITVVGLNSGLSATNEIHVNLIDNNTTIGHFELGSGGGCVACPNVYVFDEPELFFTPDPINPNDLSIDKPVFASDNYGHTQIDFRENRVHYEVTEPNGNVINFPYQVVQQNSFSAYDEMHFPFWAFQTGNYTICAWFNHADIALPAHFSETNIIPNLCLTFPHNGLSTGLDESHFEDLAKNGLFVWPNPVSGSFKVTSVTSGQYIVTNSTGQIIETGRCVKGDNTLDATNWSQGLYIMSIVDTGFATRIIRE